MAGDRTGRPTLVAALLVGALIVAAGCGWSAPSSGEAADRPAISQVPSADADAIRSTVDAVNESTSGTPADQQARMQDLVDPGRRDEVARCPAATTTVQFEPVYSGLRRIGSEPGAYALPTLIRVHSGGRLTGTDLTTLQFVVRPAADGTVEAYLTPFCVN